MNKISLAKAKEIAYQKIGIDLSDDNRPLILDKWTLDFDWGYVFYYNGKKAIETNNPEFGYIGNVPILVDKLDGATKYVGGVGQILDSQLEEYRESKGYPHSIKFPLEEDISDKPLLEQVKILFKTGEIYQIKKGLEIIKKNQLLNLTKFRSLVYNNAFTEWSLEESIAAQFKDGVYVNLSNKFGNTFPDELEIFKESKTLSISGMELVEIDENILKLPLLQSISIWVSKVEKITPKIMNLKDLNHIEIYDSELGAQADEIIGKLKSEKQIEIQDYRKKHDSQQDI